VRNISAFETRESFLRLAPVTPHDVAPRSTNSPRCPIPSTLFSRFVFARRSEFLDRAAQRKEFAFPTFSPYFETCEEAVSLSPRALRSFTFGKSFSACDKQVPAPLGASISQNQPIQGGMEKGGESVRGRGGGGGEG